MTRVLICGGREFGFVRKGCPPEALPSERKRADDERFLLQATLDAENVDRRFSLIIHGAASGADALAKAWADRKMIPDDPYPADWYPGGSRRLDKSAGPRRNSRMLAEGRPDIVIAFPGGTGTADMVAKARRAGVTVIEVSGPHG